MTTVETVEKTYGKRVRKVHTWDRDPHDFYIEPEWCSRVLFANVRFTGTVFDPACGTGRIVKAAQAAGLIGLAADIVDRGYEPAAVADFLQLGNPYDNIVSNPPFKIAREFAEHALKLAVDKVALLLPLGWLNGDARSRWLEQQPLRAVYILTPRPSMPPGEMVLAGVRPQGGKQDFAWYVFDHDYDGKPTIGWLRNPNAKRRNL